MSDKELEKYRKSFETHKATLIQDTERYLAIDWRREDGSGAYYVNYILDKKRGSIIISGDLGDCIATWYNKLSVENLKQYIGDVGYFLKKFQCASDDCTHYEDDIMDDIREQLKDYDIPAFVEECNAEYRYGFDFDDEDEFWQTIESEVCDSVIGRRFFPTETLREIMSRIDGDCFEWIGRLGERIHPRVYLWAVGFQMACEQLGL